MNHETLRQRHGEYLRSYQHSAEFAACTGAPDPALPSLLGRRWEIDRETYGEFLEILPPLEQWPGGFYLSEFIFGDITTKYTQEGGRYYCEFARYPHHHPEPRP